MRRRPEAQVVAVPPVRVVVARLIARPREVRDLVVLVAPRLQILHGEVVTGPVGLLVSRLHQAAFDLLVEDGARLDRQAVGRDVWNVAIGHLLQVGHPVLERLIGQSENQIDVEVFEAGAAGVFDGRLGLLGRVRPVHEAQIGFVERLHPDREPVDAQAVQSAQIVARSVLRIDLERHFLKRRQVEMPVELVQHAGDFFERKARGRAAAEVDRLDRLQAAVELAVVFDLGAERLHEGGMQALARDEVKIAVNAALLAKRNVKVDAGHCKRLACALV